MQRFIIKTLMFVSVLFFGFLVLFYGLKFNILHKVDECKVVVLGDSHTKYIKQPHVFNYSIPGAPYITLYNFAKEFAGQIKNKTVYVGYGYHNVSSSYENDLFNDSLKSAWISSVNQDINCLNIYPDSYDYPWRSQLLKDVFSLNKLKLLNRISFDYIEPNSVSVMTDMLLFDKTIHRHYNDSLFIEEDVIQKKYLKLLTELLKENNCQIVLVNTPVTEYYYDKVPDGIKEDYNKVLKSICYDRYLNLDSLLANQIDSSMYRDADHLNAKGDVIINNYFRLLISNK